MIVKVIYDFGKILEGQIKKIQEMFNKNLKN